ncbi:MAG: hypothetical protein GY870_20920 [archaeon]|nr:hypothetical protein [archaeon]
MYYIYFSYSIIIALLMLWECQKKKRPKWWALMVLCAPITTPWFIFQSRKASGIIAFMCFLTSFSAVGGTEFYLYAKYMEKNKYSYLPPVVRQMIHLADNLKTSTVKFDNALVKLEGLSKVESRIHEIKHTIEFINEVRKIEEENKNAISQLERYLDDYKQFFINKELSWLFNIQKFYDNHNVVQHYKSLKKYLDRFEDLLKYTYVNFYNINDLKTQEHLQNYDQYYLKYRRAVDSHNIFNVKRINFQNQFLKNNPEVKPYLPGRRQTKAFKLWE